ncbi:hypothetical protein FGE12_20000 [Aggregicoccus sp. 17bor-14]|uniref:hypothetical protein n=1 Tax=Myxococcaceae TaxID=31 RepID=UPI00129C366D|nr:MULTISPECIES: hypothetical protein [Myxococcaceae]MBF5044694.1 hypothetical protein [Simulacricoccus sp. 17bor-14]MRI90438.1 hypothetical protein [Aggregicoccus sp. 17bor-14]
MARIERMQVHSFWLEVPRRALERLPGELAPELALRLTRSPGPGGAELLELAEERGGCLLRFAPVEPADEGVVALREVQIREDADGSFFLATLGAMMVRYGGDLEAQVQGGPGARPTPVHIVRGVTDYPGLSTHSAAAHLAQAADDAGAKDRAQAPAVSAAPAASSGTEAPGAAGGGAGQEEQEVHELLGRAQAHWAEYQRLKGRRGE